jgi:hypothetical protein
VGVDRGKREVKQDKHGPTTEIIKALSQSAQLAFYFSLSEYKHPDSVLSE